MATDPPASPGKFTGFPPAAIEFYRGLEADNSKAYWTANVDVYEQSVKAPLLALARSFEAEHGTFHLFRPHRDVRFSKDKTPYKTGQGAVTEGEGGEMYYVHIDATGLFVASGYHMMAKDQLERFRAAVADDTSGPDLESRLGSLGRTVEIGGRALTAAPRGYPKDHPRIGLLQHKGLTVGRKFGAPKWLHTSATRRRVVDAWTEAATVCDWLNRHVGPSDLPPDEFRR